MHTLTRTTGALVEAPIDLTEPAIAPVTLDDLMADERVIVDLWDTEGVDGQAVVSLIGTDAAVTVTGTAPRALEHLDMCLRRGIGMEGPLPTDVEVVRHDGRDPVEADPVVGVFAPARRERTAQWRLIGDSLAGVIR